MHRDARGLVDHQAMFIFMNDGEIDQLGSGPVPCRRVGAAEVRIRRQRKALSALHFPVGRRGSAIDRERALTHPARQYRAGVVAEQQRCRTVGPFAGQVRGNFDFKGL